MFRVRKGKERKGGKRNMLGCTGWLVGWLVGLKGFPEGLGGA